MNKIDLLHRFDNLWLSSFPDGPDGSLEWCGGLGYMSDESVTLWRKVRSAIADGSDQVMFDALCEIADEFTLAEDSLNEESLDLLTDIRCVKLHERD